MRSLITLVFAALVPTLAAAAPVELAETALSPAAEDCGFCDGLCLDGECYMDLGAESLSLAQTGTCPEDPCGGLCLAGICYEVRPLTEVHEPLTETPDAAMIQWEGCPEIPCGGICLAGICSEIRPLTTEARPVRE